MATIEEEYIDNWDELSLRINEYFTHFNNYIFRGQSNKDWKLESTLSRALKLAGYMASERHSVTRGHLYKFKENIRGRVNLDLGKASDDEVWALGQHFGLATPLLDWTRSPYVALFFALNGCSKDDECALYAIFEMDVERIAKKKGASQRNVHIVSPLTHFNDRLVNQRGLFMHIPPHIDLAGWIRSGEDLDWITMYKITFPGAIREQAMSALNNMNINSLSLFPDIHGSSLHTNYELAIEPYLHKKRKEDNGLG
ncbi:FRG domain-containing protein [Aeromonas diversa]|uniref:FRG domain-containing protein n=1 Tax=Aeromonas diversa TaxID=502790 RepID=UPI0039A3912D